MCNKNDLYRSTTKENIESIIHYYTLRINPFSKVQVKCNLFSRDKDTFSADFLKENIFYNKG